VNDVVPDDRADPPLRLLVEHDDLALGDALALLMELAVEDLALSGFALRPTVSCWRPTRIV
jgi:hypothetical protein